MVERSGTDTTTTMTCSRLLCSEDTPLFMLNTVHCILNHSVSADNTVDRISSSHVLLPLSSQVQPYFSFLFYYGCLLVFGGYVEADMVDVSDVAAVCGHHLPDPLLTPS